MDKKSLKAACLAIGLAAAWSVPKQANAIQAVDPNTNVTITPEVGIENVYFLYACNGSADTYTSATRIDDSFMSGGQQYSIDFYTNTGGTDWALYGGYAQYAVIGLYDADGDGAITEADGDAVSLSMTDEASAGAVSNGAGWLDIFYTDNEPDIATALRAGDTAALSSFFAEFNNYWYSWMSGGSLYNAPVFPNIGEQGRMTNFSTAVDNGYVKASAVVPEPASIFALVSGILGIAGLRRFRR